MNVGTQRAIAVQCAFRTPAPFRVVCCVPALGLLRRVEI